MQRRKILYELIFFVKRDRGKFRLVSFIISCVKITPTEIQHHLTLLADTSRRIQTCTDGMGTAFLERPLAPGQWSPLEILAHLRACADVWTYSIYSMLAADHPTLPDIHPRRWAKVVPYLSLDFHRSLHTFTLQRVELLATLQSLPEASWARSAHIADRQHTVFSQARRMAKHEVEHCEQIEAVLRF